ncbi:hypothetical protein PHJA_002139400 [Phtheirospermum japonicum]|uniref:Uncharacterized protein n=1 Tax=Phtheirospermum japonicum TaxID=374723 RepID=A0A830CVU6_9LAMI|nr:hypothetical protein PHJA_002139400 [Phtheirospermum japonicum]
MKQEGDPHTCPSFSSYSSDRLSEIAVRVAAGISNDAVQSEDDDDFEFALVRHDADVPAEELVGGGGQIGTVFPVFDRDLLQNSGGGGESKQLDPSATVPLSKLFVEDGDNNPASCSSSEADELENIPAGWYCVWRPKAADQPAASQCKKSKSTGSASRKWKFCDLLRSNSEGGKGNSVFLTPKNREEKMPRKAKGKGVGGGAQVAPSAHEALYVRKRSIMEGNKKKSYLPYRRDLVGFFVNVNGFSKSF